MMSVFDGWCVFKMRFDFINTLDMKGSKNQLKSFFHHKISFSSYVSKKMSMKSVKSFFSRSRKYFAGEI